jgi:hypothetical protein
MPINYFEQEGQDTKGKKYSSLEELWNETNKTWYKSASKINFNN